MERPDFFELNNGEKVKLPFSDIEYKNRVSKLRDVMSNNNMDMAILTSMHNIAYYTGFIYCSFGRPYGCVEIQRYYNVYAFDEPLFYQTSSNGTDQPLTSYPTFEVIQPDRNFWKPTVLY